MCLQQLQLCLRRTSNQLESVSSLAPVQLNNCEAMLRQKELKCFYRVGRDQQAQGKTRFALTARIIARPARMYGAGMSTRGGDARSQKHVVLNMLVGEVDRKNRGRNGGGAAHGCVPRAPVATSHQFAQIVRRPGAQSDERKSGSPFLFH